MVKKEDKEREKLIEEARRIKKTIIELKEESKQLFFL
tara:strand:- start:243 stop:353 length:111 start_codon:yes stop_codon:yes gene_type:complete